MRLEITNRKSPHGPTHECIMVIRWYAAVTGSFLVEAVGYGTSPEAAETSARLLLGQARAKLNEVTAKETV